LLHSKEIVHQDKYSGDTGQEDNDMEKKSSKTKNKKTHMEERTFKIGILD